MRDSKFNQSRGTEKQIGAFLGRDLNSGQHSGLWCRLKILRDFLGKTDSFSMFDVSVLSDLAVKGAYMRSQRC